MTTPPDPESPKTEHWLNRTVLGAGLTSALGDLSYETSNVILPGFLAVLGIPAAALGAIEGIADAASSFTKLGAGYLADRLGVRKSLVVTGYALTTVGQGLMALAGGWGLILLGRVVGWLGRGIRGPLRDAILAEAITPATRGRAFGFHRAADTLGAVLGPLLGILLLSWARHLHPLDAAWPFRVVFALTLVPGVLSVASFALLVKDDRREPNPTMRLWTALRSLPAPFRRYLAAVGVFGAGDFAHTLLILGATQLLTPRLGVLHAAQVAGGLYVLRNVVTTVAAYPVGALGDRAGHRAVLVVGYALGAATALLMALAFARSMTSVPLLAVIFACAGLYVAVQDALEASLTASLVPPEVRGLSYGVLGSVNGVGDFVSSVGVGFLWTAVSPVAGFGAAAALMAVGTLQMALLRTPAEEAGRPA
ncbi:MAG: MFS transporter [Myxococcaceae bacterium]|nr:MAG: MFS transporter [Myxococcaceae bacterium]